MSKIDGTPAAAPTGCFKCGRPGHWSRDCPSSAANNSNPNPNSEFRPNLTNSLKQASASVKAASAAAKKVPRSRPKLTQDILLSDDGLGYVLRHFPRAFKCRGRGHEVEQIGASRRVRRCIDELKERVARGGDPTKLHEPPVELIDPDKEQEQFEGEHMNVEEPVADMEDPSSKDHGECHMQEEMINEIYQKANDDSSLPQQKSSETPPAVSAYDIEPIPTVSVEPSNSIPDDEQRKLRKIQITEEQRARMEANRLKALERAKQARSSQAI